MTHDEGHNYLNVRTGEFVFLTDEELASAENGEFPENMPEWQREPVRIADDWHAFRTQAFKEIAIGWLEAHGVPFFDDL